MAKPENKYKVGSTIWSVMEGDWADLTVSEIAEVLDISVNHVRTAMERIKKETGYAVPYLTVKDREGLTEQKTSCKDGTAQKSGPHRRFLQKRLRERCGNGIDYPHKA